MDTKSLIPGEATLIENIVNYFKAKGIFDEFRHECLADVDTKSSCQNLSQRVDGYTLKFVSNEPWHCDLNKNELRNKLRRHIDESGMLAVGADHVVEQVINPKIYQLFLPKIKEVVRQYVQEQTELLNKKPETPISIETVSEKLACETSENKDKTPISDPIADILSFTYKAKSKPTSITNTHIKSENVQHKHTDISKIEKKKEEKNVPETLSEAVTTSVVNEAKVLLDKEKDKIKKEEPEIQQEVLKKVVKDEVKSEKKKSEDLKLPLSETIIPVEESKANTPVSNKPPILYKKDDKNKQKLKSAIQKSSSSLSEIKKPKKESSDKSSEKHIKPKPSKSSKELPLPTKTSSSLKSSCKEEKGETLKSKLHDSSSSKSSESSVKKSKASSDKKDSTSLKPKGHSEKIDKSKTKLTDKIEPHIHQDSSSSEKGSKSNQYSSSYDSSQASDQEKSSSSILKKEKPKHFSKHAKKEKLEHEDNNSKTSSDKKRPNSGDESSSKKYRNEKDPKYKLKDTSSIEAAKISSLSNSFGSTSSIEAAKISSRSNSFGSTSSVSSSSNASKDNLTSTSDEVSESSLKDKKKKQMKDKDSCQNPLKTLPPPPPPPPSSSSLSLELTSSVEMSSMEDTQSSSGETESSDSENIEDSSSDLELESKDLINDTLNESALNSSTDNINAFYDIFLYSSSSSEFEGYENSDINKATYKNISESDISVSSVHTSDLSSFDDELSSDDDVAHKAGGIKKKLTLKEAQELIENKVILNEKNKNIESEPQSDSSEYVPNKRCSNRYSSHVSSDDEPPLSEPIRSLRRERKLNPRYSSSEYTSIFNYKKETFITKQTTPSMKDNSFNSSPKTEPRTRKTDSITGNNKLLKKNLKMAKNDERNLDEETLSGKYKGKLNVESQIENDQLSDNKMTSSEEIDSITEKEKLFQENNKNNIISEDDKLKFHKKLKLHSNSKMKKNFHSLKRKLDVSDSPLMKRPCSRSSVDSSSSEFTPNENKPFNSEKKNVFEEKVLKDCNLKSSNLTVGIKRDLFCKQRTNNNGDILGQKDIFSKNSLGKVINNSEKKTNESDTNKELNIL